MKLFLSRCYLFHCEAGVMGGRVGMSLCSRLCLKPNVSCSAVGEEYLAVGLGTATSAISSISIQLSAGCLMPNSLCSLALVNLRFLRRDMFIIFFLLWFGQDNSIYEAVR